MLSVEVEFSEVATLVHVPGLVSFCRYRSKSVPVPVRLPVCVPAIVLV